ncbi:xylulokinase [Shimia biformata]|uniref:xylulokinase n=1 Tax=Shimia biformata TaxID=1294299 RepID=UPI00194E9150|nr:xylulokinase [Shimia biformata]
MYLGLDLGTSGLRALLVREDGTPVGATERGYPVAHPHAGWSEQDPADWIAACRTTLSELKATYPVEFAGIAGIGISGQMHGATLLDSADNVLRPCILWNDTRCHAEAAALDAMPGVRDISGNIVFPGFTAPKLVWVKNHEPDVFEKVAKVLLPKDYLVFWLTGIHSGDMSDAAGTTWLDVAARDWSNDLLQASGMRADQMPKLHEGCDVVGHLRPDQATELGLAPTVRVVAGGGDNAVAACGIGAFDEGDGFVSLGTSGVLLSARDSFAPMPDSAVHTFCHAVPDKWYQMGVMLAATDSLNWLARILDSAPADLVNALGADLMAPGDVDFLPYLSGERTPHNDAQIRGGFLNLDIATDRAALTQAVIEGVSFGLRDSLEALRTTGARLDRLIAIGGGAQSRYWVQLLATTFNLPIDLPAKGELGAALGAARLAMIGVTGAAPAEVMTKPEIAETIQPNAELTGAFDDAYGHFRKLYPSVKALL